MYEAADLSIYPFFNELLKATPLPAMLDSLTGVLARPYMIDFIHHLIEEKVEFTAAMIDLDNFKSFNDHYGHSVGDRVLSTVADKLIHFVGSSGLVGRFGGDEFLIVAFIGNDYERIHDFYETMYNDRVTGRTSNVFRQDIRIDHLKLFISATLGSASFPKDAEDFETLFSLMDKTLYRGKFKGRNCYIIYVPEKHAHLEIPKMAPHSLYDIFVEIAAAFDEGGTLLERLHRIYTPLLRSAHFHYLFFIDPLHQVWDAKKMEQIGSCEDPSPLIRDGYYACGTIRDFTKFPVMRELVLRHGIHSLLLFPIGSRGRNQGYLLLSPEKNALHIWQDEELAIGFLLVRLIIGMGSGVPET